MMVRSFILLIISTLATSSGCCCCPGQCGPCGPYGGACCLCLPKPIVWDGCCNECGPSPCQSCGDCCDECGILPALRRCLTCGKGCGEIYLGEWISDPPDCCDPCDQCYGHWTGPQGYCSLGPCQRLLAALHGYRYCPRPDCGPWCNPFCNRMACGPVCGCDHCGGAGCTTCGDGPHGASIYYEGPAAPQGTATVEQFEPHSILHENWNIPKSKPEPGKPIHKAQQPPRGQMTRTARSPQLSYRSPPSAQTSRDISRHIDPTNWNPE